MNHKQRLADAAKAHGGLLYIEDVDAWIHVDADVAKATRLAIVTVADEIGKGMK